MWFNEHRSNTSLVWIRSWGYHAFANSCILAHLPEGKNLVSNGEKITIQQAELKLRDELSWLLRWIRYGEIVEEEIFGFKVLHIKRACIRISECKFEYIAEAQH